MRTVILSAGLLALLAASWPGWRPAVAGGQEVSPRLASLEIDVWPEFDRPSMLVILRAELAEDSVLPAMISLRIPTSAGRPAAVASAPTGTAVLANLGYDITDVQIDFTTVEFSTPDRFFQLEYYDGLQGDGPDRSYDYVWPGDLTVGQLVVQVQEPAGATDVSVQPELTDSGVGPEGLAFREADLGAFDAGQTVTVSVQYTKTDPRTSAEILNLQAVNPEPPDAGSGSGRGLSSWLLVAVAVAAIAVGAAVFVFSLRVWLPARASSRRRTRPKRRRRGEGGDALTCGQCGKRLRSGDRFCPACGSPEKEG